LNPTSLSLPFTNITLVGYGLCGIVRRRGHSSVGRPSVSAIGSNQEDPSGAYLFLCGLVTGTVIATPAISLTNYFATDGPYFPAPLVALGFLTLPISSLLFFIQACVNRV
jgi:hypothetical protein